jgi:hypothetical protein
MGNIKAFDKETGKEVNLEDCFMRKEKKEVLFLNRK